MLRIFPFAVSRGKVGRVIRDLEAPARLVDHLDDADVVLTVKAQDRRQPKRLRDAAMRGVRLVVVKSNTVNQVESFLRAELGLPEVLERHEAALQEVEEAIDGVLDEGRPVELAAQASAARRLQHEIVARAGLVSKSKGREPYRRVVVFPS